MNIYLAILMMLFGLAIHLGKKMQEFEDTGTAISPISYAKTHPWRIFVTIGSCAALLFLLDSMEQLNWYAAFSTGFGGSSAFDTLRAKTNNKLAAIAASEEKPV